ncbi:hypothetical protein HQ325_16610 [Rhodococcus sp. BP-349]|uniref:hypothetical protein n=1 Tax=unclassified Rhodococcus (in: high G+C Gram-positive bacteria) TaxID=192944 RepID=UPI001C9A6342|nr:MULTISPECIES: hypothetical protein [unclassified Rhodococcus (in: high G+C Gram-positive bacteria)]MBY6540297.1 hypothetical protein [Rhodococcus sp. BP-363]MBY6545678.1 hypothetical protein [Rhodococcus sp. BP-369]MBY6564908.1 hypothetical protein [Rhodococcus sp. BP-370]MBY6578156.1 hypothetical protein [Rhodococcus sp. BP-364]MBY6587457.1 hypothetical protein [Rhodococcus sp. BP-358]
MSDAQFMRMQSLDDLVRAAQLDVRTYLYGNGIDEAAQVDPNDLGIVSMANAVAGELNSQRCDTFTSPQRHSGQVHTLASPRVRNRGAARGVLPAGALWTATPLADETDTWTHSRESEPNAVYELHFTPAEIDVKKIGSAADWRRLIADHPRNTSEDLSPNWDVIAVRAAAVHLSLAGLLTAHPQLTDRVAAPSDGYRHSRSGPWAGVGDWPTVSTAWMTLPEKYTWTTVWP